MEAGSVKRARERVEVERGLDRLRSSPEKAPKPTRSMPPVAAASISRPMPMPQWPITSSESSSNADQNTNHDRPSTKGQAPQRPPRPSYVPSILDASKIQDHTPVFPSKPKAPQPTLANSWDQDRGNISQGTAYSTTPITPNSATSRVSTSSSLGSIPDFPIPTLPLLAPTRRSTLGPPPTSRRGASSYYSQSSLVPPIIEESESIKNLDESYASSFDIPEDSDEDNPDADMEEVDEDEMDEPEEPEEPDHEQVPEFDDTTGLVRNASMGKRFKPNLTTVKNGISEVDTRKKMIAPVYDSTRATQAAVARAVGMAGGRHAPVLEHNTILTPTSPSDSDSETSDVPAAVVSPSFPTFVSEKALGSTAKVVPMLSPRAARPPPLNLNAVRYADQRSSTTSLPDLIRRATRLASNLDRGRTASRLGMRDMLAQTSAGQTPPTKRNSISDLLASFPPPGLATPTTMARDGLTPRSPSPFADSTLVDARYLTPTKPEEDYQFPRRSRQCCGLSISMFVLLLAVLSLLVIAAIMVPVLLIAVPRMNANTSAAAKAATLNICSSVLPCANGGTSVVSSDSCRCVCSAGFTGSQCSVAADAGCTTVSIEGFNNATMGTAISTLLGAAASNFSIPINATALLSIFSTTNLTCTSENALVDLINPAASIKRSVSHIGAALAPRADPVMTTAGIIYAAAPTPAANPISPPPSTPTPNASGLALSTPPPSSAELPVTPHVIAFAKLAILYVLQAHGADPVAGVNAAILAQQQLQGALLGSKFAPGALGLGGNATVDLAAGTVDAGVGIGAVGRVKH